MGYRVKLSTFMGVKCQTYNQSETLWSQSFYEFAFKCSEGPPLEIKPAIIYILLDFMDIVHCLICLLLLVCYTDGIKNATELPTRLSKHDFDLTVMSKLAKEDVWPSAILLQDSQDQ